MPTKAVLEAELTRVSKELEKERLALDEFKKRLREVAKEKAEQHEWCSPGINEALSELGIEGLNQRVSFTLSIRVKMSASTKAIANEEVSELREFIESSIQNYTIEQLLNEELLDEDWFEQTIEAQDFEVTDAKVVDEE